RWRASSPAPVHPQPLLGVFTHPSFDHRRDRLHRAFDVDFAGGVARGLDGFGEINAKAMVVGQADDAGAMNRALDMAREAGDERIGLAAGAEEGHVYAVDVMLVDEHGDVAAGFEHAHEPHRRVETRWDEVTHAAFTKLDDRITHRAYIGAAVEHCGVELKFG